MQICLDTLMKVLVTGSRGFLARHSINSLVVAGHEVIGLDRRDCDLSNPAITMEALQRHKPEAIAHLAATVDFVSTDLATFYAVNALAPAVMAAHCAHTGAHLVFASGTLVHGPSPTYFGSETPVAPESGYAISKHLGERMILASGCSASIIRFCGIYGKDGPDHLGVNKAIRAAAEGVVPTVVGNGSALRNYVPVDDAARHVRQAIEGRIPGILYSSGEKQSIASMLDLIAMAWGLGSATRSPGPEARDQIAELDKRFGEPTPFSHAIFALASDGGAVLDSSHHARTAAGRN